jgi:hypothetical protein
MFNILINISYNKVKLVVDEVVMESIKVHLGHKEQYPDIGARGLDFSIKPMFFENSLGIEQQIHISLHLVFSNSS